MWVGQFAHLAFLVAIAAAYAALKFLLPADDPDRMRIDALIAVAAAAWAALLFVELLRGHSNDSLKERALSAYRRVLTRPVTLLVSDLVFAGVLAALVYLQFWFRPVEFYSAGDVEVYQSERDGPPRRLGVLKGKLPASLRLHLGERWLVFYPFSNLDRHLPQERASYTARLDVAPAWREMKQVVIPEIPLYDPTH